MRKGYSSSNKGKKAGRSGGRQAKPEKKLKGPYRPNLDKKNPSNKRFNTPKKPSEPKTPKLDDKGEIRLNKLVANAGICSRREADNFIKAGVVKVNDEVVVEMGYKVKPGDVVKFNDAVIKAEKKQYVLLNKPKDFVTTMDDPHAKRTVMELVGDACKERIYPVGRLDRNTTGLLLFTNDGEMAKTLTHPKYNVKKIYHAFLDRNMKSEDITKLLDGFELDDGYTKADAASYVNGKKNEVGLEIHSGKNRIVRRMFDALGYKVVKLDRVYFAGLTKKNLPRGRWRYLTDVEISMLNAKSFR